VKVGFVGTRPRDRDFTRELDAEVGRMAEFLRTGHGGGTKKEKGKRKKE
jgi:hypothetical protein